MIGAKENVSGSRGEGLPKTLRVKRQADFKRIMERGIQKRGEKVILFRFQDPDIKGQKFGIKITGGVKTAVLRNRIKRTIREVLRKNKQKFGRNESVVVMCRTTPAGTDLRKLRDQLQTLI